MYEGEAEEEGVGAAVGGGVELAEGAQEAVAAEVEEGFAGVAEEEEEEEEVSEEVEGLEGEVLTGRCGVPGLAAEAGELGEGEGEGVWGWHRRWLGG